MQSFLWAEDSEAALRSELTQAFPGGRVQSPHPLVLAAEFEIMAGRPLPYLVFSRQWLPNARPVQGESIRAWANVVLESVVGVLPENQPWGLHIAPHYGAPAASHRIGARAWHSATRAQSAGRKGRSAAGAVGTSGEPTPPTIDPEAGQHRSRLIREALVELLQRKRRHLLRQLRREAAPFTPTDSLVQLLLTSPEAGYLSVAPAPLPFEQRHLLSPFPKGEIPIASDKAAPSRAFAKLVEAEQRLGRSIQAGETCVDLGASPGSWTYVAVNCGARVIAVDRSSLREDLMRHRQVEFQPGDAFRFRPPRPVDWLLCDVIAAPEQTAQLLLEWLRRRWCRQFIVTVKLGDAPGTDVLTLLKRELPALTRELFFTRLCANKKEVCAFGSAA